MSKLEDLLRKKIAVAVAEAKIEMRERCAKRVVVTAGRYWPGSRIAKDLRSLPLDPEEK